MSKQGLHGLRDVVYSLNKEIEKVKNYSQKGLISGGNKVLKAAKALTPIDTGNLRNSAYIDFHSRFGYGSSTELRPAVFIGYTAVYALAVHERVEEKLRGVPRKTGSKKGKYWDSGESKFLEKALINKRQEVLKSVKWWVKK